MKLREAILKISYDDSWGIWAEAPFTPDSEARFGQAIFENGGLLDDKAFFADGAQCGEFVADYCDGEDVAGLGAEAACEMIEEYEADRELTKPFDREGGHLPASLDFDEIADLGRE